MCIRDRFHPARTGRDRTRADAARVDGAAGVEGASARPRRWRQPLFGPGPGRASRLISAHQGHLSLRLHSNIAAGYCAALAGSGSGAAGRRTRSRSALRSSTSFRWRSALTRLCSAAAARRWRSCASLVVSRACSRLCVTTADGALAATCGDRVGCALALGALPDRTEDAAAAGSRPRASSSAVLL